MVGNAQLVLRHVDDVTMAPLRIGLVLFVLASARISAGAASLTVQQLLAQQSSLELFHPTTLPSSVADVLTATPAGRRCANVDSIPIAGLNLTADEIALLPQLCWQPHEVASFPEPAPVPSVAGDSRGIPPGVICKHTQWCVGPHMTAPCWFFAGVRCVASCPMLSTCHKLGTQQVQRHQEGSFQSCHPFLTIVGCTFALSKPALGFPPIRTLQV